MAAPTRAPDPLSGGGVPLAGLLADLRPPDEVARTFLRRGWWRTETVLHDVYLGAARLRTAPRSCPTSRTARPRPA
ncbi:hypothetical protein [Streptomyces sp. RG80]|uniref:hypothetical protein n=1 Tax=Streptomyces sp. RG80 TaxID=3157340 RepID=UPI00338F507E